MAGLAARRVARYARRVWPFVVMAYRRWDALTDAEKERYRQTARRKHANRNERAVVTDRHRPFRKVPKVMPLARETLRGMPQNPLLSAVANGDREDTGPCEVVSGVKGEAGRSWPRPAPPEERVIPPYQQHPPTASPGRCQTRNRPRG